MTSKAFDSARQRILGHFVGSWRGHGAPRRRHLAGCDAGARRHGPQALSEVGPAAARPSSESPSDSATSTPRISAIGLGLLVPVVATVTALAGSCIIPDKGITVIDRDGYRSCTEVEGAAVPVG